MITDQMATAINRQINAELESAYLYLSMSLHATHMGHAGIANWFFVQSREEMDHSRILQNYMAEHDRNVVLTSKDAPRSTWATPLEMFREALAKEQEVSASIRSLSNLALEERDFATLDRLSWFETEQVEEELSARTLVNDFEEAENNATLTYLLEGDLAKRCYSMAKPLKA